MNPEFQFDWGGYDDSKGGAAAPASWSLKRAIAQADKGNGGGISIDERIRRRQKPNTNAVDPEDNEEDHDVSEQRDRIDRPNGQVDKEDSEDSEEETGFESDENSDDMGESEEEEEEEEEYDNSEDSDEGERSGIAVEELYSRLTTEKAESSEDEDEEYEQAQSEQKMKAIQDGVGNAASAKSKKKGAFFDLDAASKVKFQSKSFQDLNLSRPLIKACDDLGFIAPTPIQTACIPLALSGRDICGSATTGSGKTAAFSLPMVDRLLYRSRRVPVTRCLILSPTRELAVQTHSMIEKLAQYTDVRIAAIVGGLNLKAQETILRSQPDIVVATPGRLIDHVRNTRSVGLEDLQVVVLDEADRLLELGFSAELQEIIKMCPKERQTLLFSATMSEQVQQLAKLSLKNPVRISANNQLSTATTLSQEVVRVRPHMEGDKEAILLALCHKTFTSKTIIFTKMKTTAHRLKIFFGLFNLPAGELHGNLTQSARLQALEDFKNGETKYLFATDVAARGLDILGVETVINFDFPSSTDQYMHRVGRTARAGSSGKAVSLALDKDYKVLKVVGKNNSRKLMSRTIPPDRIAYWRTKIEEVRSDVVEIAREEKEEKAMRMAEMEAEKAENMIEHKEEIMRRPRRTWFQSEKEKKASKLLGAAENDVNGKREGGKKISKSKDSKGKSAPKRARSSNKLSEEDVHMQKRVKMMAKSLKRTEKSGKRLPSANDKRPTSKQMQKVQKASDIEGFAKRSNQKKGKGKGSFKSKMRHKRR